MSRFDLRKIVTQTLFECDFKNKFDLENIQIILKRNFEEQNLAVPEFAEKLALGVLAKKEVLDKVILKAAPEWPIEKIDNVDRNILRIGLWELMFPIESTTPQKVAINEAIELARAFSGETSSKFVNGVLGNVLKDLNTVK